MRADLSGSVRFRLSTAMSGKLRLIAPRTCSRSYFSLLRASRTIVPGSPLGGVVLVQLPLALDRRDFDAEADDLRQHPVRERAGAVERPGPRHPLLVEPHRVLHDPQHGVPVLDDLDAAGSVDGDV